ncbi:MAG TPA: 50S ribosomal protein L21 [Solirubrobacteraceae bacterium]|nr:50S ribosomal protein L21 [Solirubrobacteraceae bacterium]
MYAIVKTGGKQYRVERGQRLVVERLAAAEGESVALQPILYRSEEAVFDRAGLEKVKVTARVIAHERGEKLRVFKFKPKRGYKRRNGHRQELTRIEVTELALSGDRSSGIGQRAKVGEAVPAKAGAAKPVAAKPAPAKPAPAKPASAEAASAAPEAKAAAKPKTAAPVKPRKAAKEAKTDGA